jgi:NAD(P)-dependent dehydrogenase (short-subunit alcohol dehydrogenase family)
VLITMTRAFAKDPAAHHIRVNALLPGITDTTFSSVLMQNKAIFIRSDSPPQAAGLACAVAVQCDGGLLA